jgi:hypothetical protein
VKARFFALVVVCLAALLPACSLFPPAGERATLLFRQGESACRAEEDKEWGALAAEERALRFTGQIAADTPCQHLLPALSACGRDLLVTIEAIPQPGACPLCLGIVDYEGTILGLEPGTYRVRIHHGERTVLDLLVTLGD